MLVSHTRYIFCLFLLISLSSCTVDNEPIERLKDFEYPLDSLNKGKLFVYKKNAPQEYFFIEQKRMTDNGVDYLLYETYNTKQKLSSDKFIVSNSGIQFIETYLYTYLDSLNDDYKKDKGEILEVKNLNDGLKYRGTLIKTKNLTSGKFAGSAVTRERFAREDKFRLKDRSVDVLVFTSETEAKAWLKLFPLFSTKTKYTGENYYARGFGLVKFSMGTDAKYSEWTLIEIKNLK